MNKVFVIGFYDAKGNFKGYYTENTDWTKFRNKNPETGEILPYSLIASTKPNPLEPYVFSFNEESYEYVQSIMKNLYDLNLALEPRLMVYSCLETFTGKEDFYGIKSEIKNSFD
jgi:hypothetical protein